MSGKIYLMEFHQTSNLHITQIIQSLLSFAHQFRTLNYDQIQLLYHSFQERLYQAKEEVIIEP